MIDHVLVRDECGFTLAQIAYTAAGGWTWHCRADRCNEPKAPGHLSVSAALADFEAHVERRHP